MTTGLMAPEQNLEKQMPGCMAGFLHIFHRHHLLTGKRLPSTNRLPPSVVDSESDSDNPLASPPISLKSGKLNLTSPELSHPPGKLRPPPLTPLKTQTHPPHPLHASYELKESIRSTWKFSKDAPRLSLDSRAIVDAKGSIYPREIRTKASILSVNSNGTGDDGDKQHRSPSVIARLMGLEPLSNSDSGPVKKAELRRSSSESRVSKDFYQYRFVDGNNFQRKQSNLQGNTINNVVAENVGYMDHSSKGREADRPEVGARNIKVEATKASHNIMGQRKSFFESADVLYEQQQTASMYGEIGKMLGMRPSDDSFKDLDTLSLRQILKALQLKGLLHSERPSNQTSPRNMVLDRHFYQRKSDIVVMKPVKSGSSSVISRAGARWSSNIVGETFPSVNVRRDRAAQNQQGGRRFLEEKNLSRRGGALKIEMQRARTDPAEESQRSLCPVQSGKTSPRRIGLDPQISNRQAKNKKSTPPIFRREPKISSSCQAISKDESSISVSESSDAERCSNYKGADNGGGNNLLDRCDRLLSSIAETNAAELLPSPISVLDSSFYQDESSPSPVLKRQIHSKDHHVEVEDEAWSEGVSSGELQKDDCDLAYISDILRASSYFPDDSNNVFLLLEKQQYVNGKDISKVSTLERKLTFDAINEILERNRQLPPWRPTTGQPLVKQIWCEIRRAEERAKTTRTEDLVDFICSALRADLATDGVYGWGDSAVLMSPVVLDMERLIFKDLISETIGHHLALFAGSCRSNHPQVVPRRKLVF